MTPTTSDPLADRVVHWHAQITADSHPTDELALQGWALKEALRRRGPSGEYLVETIEKNLPPLPAAHIADQIEKANQVWNDLLTDLDSTKEDFDQLRQQTHEVFFKILEALILAEDASSDEETLLAQQLFNAVINDLYVFESMADVAAELERTNKGKGSVFPPVELSDLFCSAIAGLFEGQIRPRAQIQTEAEEFIPLNKVIRTTASTKPITPAALEKRLAAIPFWFIKWATQRLTLAIVAKTGELHAYVWNGDNPATLALSQDLNGWQIRISQDKETISALIADANATLKLPKRIDPAAFTLQIKDPAAQDWIELFGRVEQSS